MGLRQKNVAYDLSLFEVAPKKEESNLIELPKQKSKAKHRFHPLSMIFTGFLASVCVATALLFIHSQVQLMEINERINQTYKSLDESKNVYTQLQMKVGSQLSLSSVEDFAKDVLEMRKMSPYQVEYVSLSDGDKSEISKSEGSWNFLEKLRDIFCGLR